MIELQHLSKSYRTTHGRKYVFRDLSCVFPEGKNIGLIGRNGAGKSTLMRLIGGMDTPDHGKVLTDKSISWPVGLAGGFQGSLSGRDNVKFVCRIYGATGQAMLNKIRFVEEFAEIGEYFDQPVKSYSSGMSSRVSFGLSMAFDFDYLLIDEVMAVGDAHFRQKCQTTFDEKRGQSNMILVSHNMGDIRRFCDLVLLVQDGQVLIYDDIEEGIRAYQGTAYTPPPQAKRTN